MPETELTERRPRKINFHNTVNSVSSAFRSLRLHGIGLLAVLQSRLLLHLGQGLRGMDVFAFRRDMTALPQRFQHHFRGMKGPMAVELLNLFATTETVGDDQFFCFHIA